MWQERVVIGNLIALLLCAIGCLSQPVVNAAEPKSPATIPEFSLKMIGGENFRLSEHRGEIVLLGFWAGWCGDCRQAMQALNTLHEKYANAGVQVLGINVGDSLDQSASMANSLMLHFPVLVDEQRNASSQFFLKKMPLVVLIDREGRMRFSHAGFERGDDKLITAQLRELINE